MPRFPIFLVAVATAFLGACKDAVRTALANTRYRPAEAGGRSVRQLVEQNFTFRLEK